MALFLLAQVRQCLAEVVVGAGVVGTHGQRLGPLRNSRRVLALLGQVRGHVVLLVEVHRRRVDVLNAAGRHVDELGNIHGAIGGSGVLDQNGRGVVAFCVDVRQETSAYRASGSSTKTPASGRWARSCARSSSAAYCRSCGAPPARRGNDVELAVGPHQQAVVGLDEDDPACRPGEILGKLLLMPLCEAPSMGSALPPLPSLKGMR